MIEILNFRCVFERFILFLPAVKNLTLLDILLSVPDEMQTSREIILFPVLGIFIWRLESHKIFKISTLDIFKE